MPLVYTPTVGEGCQRFSEIWRKPRGIFLSYPNRHRIREILAAARFDRVKVIVVSDGERILGLGDQGAGGMGIPIGKLALYTACAGIHPDETLPILLDVGTNNRERLDDPIYIGWRHERVTGADYDAFIEEFVAAVIARWPDVVLQWEDFAGSNAGRLLEKYRDRLCTFNDDIQGTAAVAAGAVMAAINVTGAPLTEQRIALLGAGSAGCGIAALLLQAMVDDGLSPEDARRRFFAVDRGGLLLEGMINLTTVQCPLAQSRDMIADWSLRKPGEVDLLDVVSNVRPTVLIGVSGQAGVFTEPVIRAMARGVDRPLRGDPAAAARLDQRPGADRRRQPVRARSLGRTDRGDRPDQQLLHLPGRGSRADRLESPPGHRRDVHGRRPGARRAFAPSGRQGRAAAAAGRSAAAGGAGHRPGGGASGPGRRRRRALQRGRNGRTHPRPCLGAKLPALRQAEMTLDAQALTPSRRRFPRYWPLNGRQNLISALRV